MILEAVADQDLWFWHAFFGTPGAFNDINVLQRSTVFNGVINGDAPKVEFEIEGNKYHHDYYLADGIYPKWSTLVTTVKNPNTLVDKARKFELLIFMIYLS